MITTWGYEFTTLQTLPDMLTVADFNIYTDNKYAGQSAQAEKEISAACAAIRNFVGWHLSPSAECEMKTTILDRRVTPVGSDIVIQLPARVVTSVRSVTIGSTTVTNYHCEQNGLLRVYDFALCDRKTEIDVIYTAGLDSTMLAPIQELIAHRVTHALAVPSGITSEASGGVSVTYNANWINNSRATALAGDNKELLVPYRVQGVF